MSNLDDRTDVEKKIREFWKEVDDDKKRLIYDPQPDRPLVNGTGKPGLEQTYQYITTDIELPILDGAQRAIKEFVDMLAEEDEPQNGPVDNLFSSKKSSSRGVGGRNNNIYIRDAETQNNLNTIKSEQLGEQLGNNLDTSLDDNSRDWGELSKAFDAFLKDNPQPHYRKEIADYIGCAPGAVALYRIIQRRRKGGKIRILRNDRIQWVNNEWQECVVSLEAGKRSNLDIKLPFGAEKYISIPEHSQIVVAGDIGSGKTHFAYELAELNVDKFQIRHFFNEIGDQKGAKLLEDFPALQQAYKDNYFLINADKENLDVFESLDPTGLNIFDYLHLHSTEQWFLSLQRDLARLSEKLETGVIVVMLQKIEGKKSAMGGDSTRMQCQVYFTLNVTKKSKLSKEGIVRVEKCKDWASDLNPEALSVEYKTGPLHGKLIQTTAWGNELQVTGT